MKKRTIIQIISDLLTLIMTYHEEKVLIPSTYTIFYMG
jgi:hypothetical protein